MTQRKGIAAGVLALLLMTSCGYWTWLLRLSSPENPPPGSWTLAPPMRLYDTLTIEGDTLYAGSMDGGLAAIDLPTYTLKWFANFNESAEHAPLVNRAGTVFVMTRGDRLPIVGPDGRLKTVVQLPTALNDYNYAALDLEGNAVVGTQMGRVVKISPEGAILWTRTVPDMQSPSVTVLGNGTLLASENRIVAFSPEGKTEWSFDPPKKWYQLSRAAALPDGSATFVMIKTLEISDRGEEVPFGVVVRINAEGNVLWQAEFRDIVPGDPRVFPPPLALSDGRFAALCSDGFIHLVGVGSEPRRTSVASRLWYPGVSDQEGNAYVVPERGDLIAVSSKGRFLWRRKPPDGMRFSAPAYDRVRNVLYVPVLYTDAIHIFRPDGGEAGVLNLEEMRLSPGARSGAQTRGNAGGRRMAQGSRQTVSPAPSANGNDPAQTRR